MSEAAVGDIEDLYPACSCAKCAALCEMLPGRMDLDDAERLQEHLGGPAALLDNIVFELGPIPGTHTIVHIPRPRVVTEPKGGSVCTLMSACGDCVFLDKDTGCTLTNETGRPVECRTSYGCVGMDHKSEEIAVATTRLFQTWGTPRAKAFMERLEAVAKEPLPMEEVIASYRAERSMMSTPYGMLALTVKRICEQSVLSKASLRLARLWKDGDDSHKSVKTGKLVDPTNIVSKHRDSIVSGLREAAYALHAARAEIPRNDAPAQELVEMGRKSVRLDILEMIHTLDTDLAEMSGNVEEETGELVYKLRSWMETLTRN